MLKEEIKRNKDYFLQVLNYYNVIFDKKEKKALCPFHNDHDPSLGMKQESNGVYIFKCFSCGTKGDIFKFVELHENITFTMAAKKIEEILNIHIDDIKTSEGNKLYNFISFLKEKNTNFNNSYVYKDLNNNPLYIKVKFVENSKKTFVTKALIETENGYKFGTKEDFSNTQKVIYNYKKVKEAIEKNNNIYFVEGEKDADNLIKLGFTATTIYSKNWDKQYTEQLKGSKIVFIGDTGQAGEQFKNFIYENLKPYVLQFKVIDLPGIEKLGDNKDVSDWLDIKGNTKEKLVQAIKNGWDWIISEQWKDVKIIQKKDGNQEIKPLKTIDNFKILLNKTKTTVFFNEISKQIEAKTEYFNNINLNTLTAELLSYCIKEGLSCNLNDVTCWLNAVAYENKKNPFRDYLDSLKDKWDGKSRLKEYYSIFQTVEYFNQDLKEMIIYRWLLQFLGSAYDKNFTSQGMLILKGRQGLGKTRTMKNLIPIDEPWVFIEEQKFENNRDAIQTITTNQLVELSEFARSNKQVDALKAFVTSPYDKLMLKWEKYPIEFKRLTVFYATINDVEFLIDDENRRFWIIDLKNIDTKKAKDFDYNQLWSELYYIYHNVDNRYWLEDEEIQILEDSNQQYKFKGELEGLIETTFNFASDYRIWLTTPEVINFIGKNYSPTKVTRALKSMRIEQKKFNNKLMPNNRYNAMPFPNFWKGKIPIKYKNRLVNLKLVDDKQQKNTTNELQKEINTLKDIILKLEEENQNLKNKLLSLEEQKIAYQIMLNENVK